jgi:hypothetical protein
MPKSRRGKGKHFHYSKKSKAMRRQGMTATGAMVSSATNDIPETPVHQSPRPVTPAVNPPVMKSTGSGARVMANPDPYLIGEIKRIAVIVGIVVVVLVVLSFVLS